MYYENSFIVQCSVWFDSLFCTINWIISPFDTESEEYVVYGISKYGYSAPSKDVDPFYWGMHNAKKTSIYNHTVSTKPGDKTLHRVRGIWTHRWSYTNLLISIHGRNQVTIIDWHHSESKKSICDSVSRLDCNWILDFTTENNFNEKIILSKMALVYSMQYNNVT